MWLVARSVLGLFSAVLLCGTATLALGQESPADDLRLETEPVEEDIIKTPPQVRTTPITIGDDDRLPTIRRRTQTEDPYAAQGLDTGAFLVFPSLQIGSVVSTNPRRAPKTTDVDGAASLKPRLAVQSEWFAMA
jgi:hypothetical protein